MILIGTVLFFILGGFARVWFGADDLPKFWQNRGVQTAFMMLLFIACFFNKSLNILGWCVVVAVTCWLQFQFWSRGHGEVADCGRHTNITEKDIERYN